MVTEFDRRRSSHRFNIPLLAVVAAVAGLLAAVVLAIVGVLSRAPLAVVFAGAYLLGDVLVLGSRMLWRLDLSAVMIFVSAALVAFFTVSFGLLFLPATLRWIAVAWRGNEGAS